MVPFTLPLDMIAIYAHGYASAICQTSTMQGKAETFPFISSVRYLEELYKGGSISQRWDVVWNMFLLSEAYIP